MQKVKFKFSGDEEDFCRVIREFKLCDILEKVSIESSYLFKNDNLSETRGTRRVSFKTQKRESYVPQNHELLIMAWDLVDLAYSALLYTNDYRGKTIQCDEEFYGLIYETSVHNQKYEEDLLKEIDDNDLFIYLWGFCGEQFKIESPNSALDNLGRDLYILFESSKTSKRKIDAAQIVIDEIGVDWKKVVVLLFFAWFASTQCVYLSDYEKKFDWDRDDITINDFYKVISYYTVSDKEIRESSLHRQLLYTKPFVVNRKKQVMSINCYLNLFLYEHSIFWIIRNYYLKKKDQYFTSVFGDYFEEYFRELLETYLNAEEYLRIPETNAKRADWELDICGFKFLIEQKSALISLLGKQQKSDINEIKNFAQRHLFKALKQLKETEDAFDDGKYIKIILLYEDYLEPEILNNVFKIEGCDIENDDFFWIVRIDEMERLLQLCESNREKFVTIIEEKIKREVGHSKEGKGLRILMDALDVPRGKYVQSEKFAYYRNYAHLITRGHLKG